MSVTFPSDFQASPAIRLNQVTAGYDRNIVFSDLSLEIAPGQFAGIVGPTACGKSTLLKIILGTHPVISGKIQLNKMPAGKVKPGTIGYVPQLESVDWNFPVTVEEVIMMGLYTNGRIWPWLSKGERSRIHEIAERLGVDDCLHHHIIDISGGQRQRVAIARALVGKPAILLADEPTGNLDSATSHAIMDLFSKLNQERGITVVLITHEQDIAAYARRVVRVQDGRIVEDRVQ